MRVRVRVRFRVRVRVSVRVVKHGCINTYQVGTEQVNMCLWGG